MKIKTIVLIALSCAALLFGCSDPFSMGNVPAGSGAGYGTVSVNFTGDEGRTVFPAQAFDNYVYTFKKGGTPVATPELVDGKFTLETGTNWTVEVKAYAGAIADANLAATGTSETFAITDGGNTPVTVTLTGTEATGAGTFTFTINYPAGTSVAELSLKKLPALAADVLTPAPVAGPTSVSGTDISVGAGFYLLTVNLTKDGKEAGTAEVIHIYNKLASEYIRTFAEAEFIAPVEWVDPATQTTPLTGGTQLLSYTGGNKNLTDSPYGYEVWDFSEGNGSTNTFTWYGTNQGGGGAFKVTWTSYMLARLGYYWGNGGPYTQYNNIYVDYNFNRSANNTSPSGGFIGVYGWSRNPSAAQDIEKLIEYYIVDDWFWDGQCGKEHIGGWDSSSNQCEELGSFEVDGATYKIYKNPRINEPSIDGDKTFIQIFSVRQGRRTYGTISVTEHFKAWSKYLTLGSMFEAKFKVEAFADWGGPVSGGYLDLTYLYLSQEETRRNIPEGTTPVDYTGGGSGGEQQDLGTLFGFEWNSNVGPDSTMTGSMPGGSSVKMEGIKGTDENNNYAELQGAPDSATLTALKGITQLKFDVLGDGNSYRISFPTTDTASTYNHWGYTFTTTDGVSMPITVNIPGDLGPSWGPTEGSIVRNNITNIQFGAANTGAFELTISNLEIVTDGTGTGLQPDGSYTLDPAEFTVWYGATKSGDSAAFDDGGIYFAYPAGFDITDYESLEIEYSITAYTAGTGTIDDPEDTNDPPAQIPNPKNGGGVALTIKTYNSALGSYSGHNVKYTNLGAANADNQTLVINDDSNNGSKTFAELWYNVDTENSGANDLGFAIAVNTYDTTDTFTLQFLSITFKP